jgi:hypothetical protein
MIGGDAAGMSPRSFPDRGARRALELGREVD